MDRPLALITGATSGIGAAFAEKLAGLGHDLILTGRRRDRLEAVATAIAARHDIRAKTRIVEFADPRALESLATEAATREVAVLVNNAGFSVRGEFGDLDMAGHAAMIGTHVTAPVRLVHAVLPGMLSRGGGTIVNVSSLSAFLPRAGSAMYASTKSFLLTWSLSLHAELSSRGIRVQALCPGFTRTDFHERMGLEASTLHDRGLVRWMDPERVVGLSFKNLKQGSALCVPGMANRFLAALSPLLLRYFASKRSRS